MESEVKRVLILMADVGFGHRSAANAVAAALRERYGDQVSLEVVNPLADKRVPAFLRKTQSDFDKVVRHWPKLYRLGYATSDAAVPTAIVESALVVSLFEVLREMVRSYDPHVIVATHPFWQAPLAAVYAIHNHYVPLLTVVTDLATVHRLWFNDVVDRCLVPTTTVYDLASASGLTAEQLSITGIPVHPKFGQASRSRAEVRADLGWQPDLMTFLAVGSKRVGHLAGTLDALNHSGFPLQLAMVAGGDDELYAQLSHMDWHVSTHLYNFVDNMPTLMHAADAIICKAGGLIVTESLACGLPLLLVDVLPGQEQGNAAHVIEGGAADLVDSPLAALKTVAHWLSLDGALLAQRAENSRRLGHPDAAYRIAESVWQAALRGPAMRPDLRSRLMPKLKELFHRFDIPWEDL